MCAQGLVDGLGFNLTASPMVFKQGAVVIHRITKILPDDYTMIDFSPSRLRSKMCGSRDNG